MDFSEIFDIEQKTFSQIIGTWLEKYKNIDHFSRAISLDKDIIYKFIAGNGLPNKDIVDSLAKKAEEDKVISAELFVKKVASESKILEEIAKKSLEEEIQKFKDQFKEQMNQKLFIGAILDNENNKEENITKDKASKFDSINEEKNKLGNNNVNKTQNENDKLTNEQRDVLDMISNAIQEQDSSFEKMFGKILANIIADKMPRSSDKRKEFLEKLLQASGGKTMGYISALIRGTPANFNKVFGIINYLSIDINSIEAQKLALYNLGKYITNIEFNDNDIKSLNPEELKMPFRETFRDIFKTQNISIEKLAHATKFNHNSFLPYIRNNYQLTSIPLPSTIAKILEYVNSKTNDQEIKIKNLQRLSYICLREAFYRMQELPNEQTHNTNQINDHKVNTKNATKDNAKTDYSNRIQVSKYKLESIILEYNNHAEVPIFKSKIDNFIKHLLTGEPRFNTFKNLDKLNLSPDQLNTLILYTVKSYYSPKDYDSEINEPNITKFKNKDFTSVLLEEIKNALKIKTIVDLPNNKEIRKYIAYGTLFNYTSGARKPNIKLFARLAKAARLGRQETFDLACYGVLKATDEPNVDVETNTKTNEDKDNTNIVYNKENGNKGDINTVCNEAKDKTNEDKEVKKKEIKTEQLLFSNTIKDLKKHKNINIVEISKALTLNFQHWNKIENGETGLQDLKHLAKLIILFNLDETTSKLLTKYALTFYNPVIFANTNVININENLSHYHNAGDIHQYLSKVISNGLGHNNYRHTYLKSTDINEGCLNNVIACKKEPTIELLSQIASLPNIQNKQAIFDITWLMASRYIRFDKEDKAIEFVEKPLDIIIIKNNNTIKIDPNTKEKEG